MNRLQKLQSALLKEIDKYEELIPERDQPGDWERIHISSCAKLGYLMAEKQGVDPILAACGITVLDQENSSPELSLFTGTVADTGCPYSYQHAYPYHGKVAPASATVSSLAKQLKWDEKVWDLSGNLPVLK